MFEMKQRPYRKKTRSRASWCRLQFIYCSLLSCPSHTNMSLVRRVGECVVITAILAILYAYGQHIPLHASHLVVFFCGLFTPALLKFIIVRRLFRTSANGRQNNPNNSVYGLEHGRLNLKLPNTMWMNMGYWKVRAFTRKDCLQK
jgi:hypothetical protein